MPHSCAIAGRCSAALVEPPDAATTAAAFSSALRVTMSRGRMFWAHRCVASSPGDMQKAAPILQGPGVQAEYGSARPMAREVFPMVLPVNRAPQAPAEG